MRLTSVPDALAKRWLILRLICYGLLAPSFAYVGVMFFFAATHGEQRPQSVIEWQGINGPGFLENETTIIAVWVAVAVASLVAAFVIRSWLIKRPLSSLPSAMALALPDTPQGLAFAQFHLARMTSIAVAETASLIGLLTFLLVGRFLYVALPLVVLSVAVKIVLLPTETQLLRHLESAERDGSTPDATI